MVLNKYIIIKNVKKINFNDNKITNTNINYIVSGGNRETIKNYSLEYKIKQLTGNHPKFLEIVIDNKDDFSAVIGNFTKSDNNAIQIVSKGVLHKNEVYVYNQVTIEKLNKENIDNLEEIINENKDIIFTNKVQSSEICSNNLNNFIEKKTNQQIFLKNEQIGIEGKIQRIRNYIDDVERINNRED
jgi:hypothetical protein